MLDLDAIEKEITADKYGDKRFGPQCLQLIAELRKCLAAMEEAVNLCEGIMPGVSDRLRDTLRGAK